MTQAEQLITLDPSYVYETMLRFKDPLHKEGGPREKRIAFSLEDSSRIDVRIVEGTHVSFFPLVKTTLVEPWPYVEGYVFETATEKQTRLKSSMLVMLRDGQYTLSELSRMTEMSLSAVHNWLQAQLQLGTVKPVFSKGNSTAYEAVDKGV